MHSTLFIISRMQTTKSKLYSIGQDEVEPWRMPLIQLRDLCHGPFSNLQRSVTEAARGARCVKNFGLWKCTVDAFRGAGFSSSASQPRSRPPPSITSLSSHATKPPPRALSPAAPRDKCAITLVCRQWHALAGDTRYEDIRIHWARYRCAARRPQRARQYRYHGVVLSFQFL